MKQVIVRLDGKGGLALPQRTLESVYLSGLDFEPQERRARVLGDGTVEIAHEGGRYMVHARLQLPLYGTIWAIADNLGEGYTGGFVDFVSEAARSYLHLAEEYARGVELSPEARGHLLAAQEYTHLANRGQSTGENRLYALSHAVYAAEAALFERSRQAVARAPRPDLLLGCNFFRFEGAGTRYARLFSQLFDYATLPFYPNRTAPEEGRFEYGYIDRALSYLDSKGIRAKGHPLWFGHREVNPPWLLGRDFPRLGQAARDIAASHVGRYKGRIAAWDAMNEAHDWANCFELSQEQQLSLTGTLCAALREQDPRALSIVNVCLPFAEYVAGRYTCYGALPKKLLSPMAYLRRLADSGADYDAVGIQLYFPARDMVSVDRLLRVYEGFGKPIHITEMGVNGGSRQGNEAAGRDWAQLSLSEGSWHGGWNERSQADWMEQFYTLAAARPGVTALTWWDFIEPSFSGNGAFLYEDENPREIYFRLLALKDFLRGAKG